MPITRRELLEKAGATAAVAAGLGPSLFARVADSLETPAPSPSARGRCLVIIQMAGGNDGLNTIVPHADPLYRKLRPTIALPANELLQVDEHLSLHSALAPLKARLEKGQLALVEGVGLPKPDRSHFVSTAVWQTGHLEPYRDPSGWLGRALDAGVVQKAAPGAPPLPAVGVGGGGLTPVFYAARTSVPSVLSLDAFTVQPDRRYPGDAPALRKTLDELYAAGAHSPLSGFVEEVGRTALSSSDSLRSAVTGYSSDVAYPRGPFGDQLRLVAQLMVADLPARLFHVTLGGFDTHANQRPQQRALLAQLADGITALLHDLEAHSLGDRVAVMTYSEFGRRVAENASAGTDHGAASVLFVAGAAVAGGLHGPVPDLSRLADGDIPVSVDFRSVYAAVLRDWLGVPPAKVLGADVAPLPLFRA